MAVEGFKLLGNITLTSTAGVNVFPTDITIIGPADVGIELQLQIFSATASIISVDKNGVLFPINNNDLIQGVINFTMVVEAGDTINVQTSIDSVITVLVLGGGAS